MTAGAIALVTAGAGFASTVNSTANVVFIVDESGSMGGDQDFLTNTVIGGLDAGLSAAGVTNRSYGVVGFGGSISSNAPRVLGSGLTNAADAKTNLGSLTTSGGTEDGIQAIDFALTAFNFDAGAAVNFILVTDEGRRDGGTNSLDNSLTFAGMAQTLAASNILLNAVVSNRIDSDGGRAIGVDSDGNAYLADGNGGVATSTNGVANNTSSTGYIDTALKTGGAGWDLGILRRGGNDALSFAQAFIDIKVQEIISQPPTGGGPNPPPVAPIPRPAAGWLLLGGLGALGFMRRRAEPVAA
jgi:hypothetical protein